MRTAEVLVARILFWGGVVSIVLMALGMAGFLWSRGDPDVVFTSVGEVVRALARWPVEPLAVVAAGILLLLATPVVAVVAVFAVFARAGDRRYAGIAAVLIAALLVSLIFVGGG